MDILGTYNCEEDGSGSPAALLVPAGPAEHLNDEEENEREDEVEDVEAGQHFPVPCPEPIQYIKLMV
jgi:hypothetical protein